jgi:hypothetical protein
MSTAPVAVVVLVPTQGACLSSTGERPRLNVASCFSVAAELQRIDGKSYVFDVRRHPCWSMMAVSTPMGKRRGSSSVTSMVLNCVPPRLGVGTGTK